jgi:hypothetical protein
MGDLRQWLGWFRMVGEVAWVGWAVDPFVCLATMVGGVAVVWVMPSPASPRKVLLRRLDIFLGEQSF